MSELPAPLASMSRSDHDSREIRLDLTVAEQLRKPEHLADIPGDDRRYARRGKRAEGPIRILGERWPLFCLAQREHSDQVPSGELRDLAAHVTMFIFGPCDRQRPFAAQQH